MRYKLRKDDNHNTIANVFRKLGASVAETHRLGEGFPDLVIGFMGYNALIEVKDGAKSESRRKLTDAEFEFFEGWRGWVAVVKDENDAINIINQIQQEKVYATRGFMASAPGQQFSIEPLPEVIE